MEVCFYNASKYIFAVWKVLTIWYIEPFLPDIGKKKESLKDGIHARETPPSSICIQIYVDANNTVGQMPWMA